MKDKEGRPRARGFAATPGSLSTCFAARCRAPEHPSCACVPKAAAGLLSAPQSPAARLHVRKRHEPRAQSVFLAHQPRSQRCCCCEPPGGSQDRRQLQPCPWSLANSSGSWIGLWSDRAGVGVRPSALSPGQLMLAIIGCPSRKLVTLPGPIPGVRGAAVGTRSDGRAVGRLDCDPQDVPSAPPGAICHVAVPLWPLGRRFMALSLPARS